MIQTITQINILKSKKIKKIIFDDFAEPSLFTIQNIINYSKNLEIKQSLFLKEIEFLKS